jgi:hypothetical protein
MAPPPPGVPPTPYPGYPSYPSYPTNPPYSGVPGYPGAPSMPLAPDPNVPPGTFGAAGPPSMPYPVPPPGYAGPPSMPYPGYPTAPGYPTYPGPGYPTAPGYPTYPGPGYPGYPGAPVTVPLYGQTLAPAGATVDAKAPSRWNPATWVKGPLPVPLVIILVCLALLGVAGGAYVGSVLNQGDWASGAIAAGYVALVLAALSLIVVGLRVGFGRRAATFFAVGIASIVILGALGGSGLVLLPTPLHRAQAQSLESAQKWSDAVAQFQKAGEHAPGSHDLARVYDEWGDDLAGQKLYVQASAQYEYVTATFTAATAELQRAKDSDARVLFEYGTQLAGQGQLQQALDQFAKVITTYPTSSYAAQAHASSATAYYTLGQQAIQSGDCSSALPIYQNLVQQYSDTAEGAEAKHALAAPVAVSGQINNLPGTPVSYVALSSRVTGPIATQVSGNFDGSNLSQDYRTQLQGGGQFKFSSVAQGKYNLAAFFTDGSIVAWYNTQSGYTPYVITVGPLCPVDTGTFSY